MSSFIVFLAIAIAAIIGPWVDAPPFLSTASGFAAILVAFLSMTSMRRQLKLAQEQTQVQKAVQVPPEINESAGGSMLQSRLQVESMRSQALEAELRETKKRNDELIRERIEYRRHAALQHDADAIAPVTVDSQRQASREAAQSLRQRDQWIQTQQASLGEFRSDLGQIKNSLSRCLGMFNTLSFGGINEAIANKDGLHLKLLLTSLSESLRRMQSEGSNPMVQETNKTSIKTPETLDAVCSEFVTLNRRLEEISDNARITAMNAGLLKDRPIEADSLENISQETAVISNQLADLVRLAAPMSPAMEAARRQIEANNIFSAAQAEAVATHQTQLDGRFKNLSAEARDYQIALDKLIKSSADSGKIRGSEINQIQSTFDEATDALTSANSIADSLDLTINRMVQVALIATGFSDKIKTPLEVSAID